MSSTPAAGSSSSDGSDVSGAPGTATGATASEDAATASYMASWRALNVLMRRGLSWSGNERHKAYWQKDGRFFDVSNISGLDWIDDGRASVPLDWDFDGRQDLLVSARSAPRIRLLVQEDRPTGAFLGLRLQPRTSLDAIGARVEVTLADGTRLVRSQRAASGYLAQPGGWLHVGLGADLPERRPVRVVVRWPDGERQDFGALEPSAFHVLEQGSGTARAFQPPRTSWRDEPRAFERPAVRSTKRIVPVDPVPLPRLVFRDEDRMPRALFGVRQDVQTAPLLVVLTANWCAPCRVEQGELVARGAELAERGLAVLALATDTQAEWDAVDAADEALGWGRARAQGRTFVRGYLEPDGLALLDALQGVLRDDERPLALSTSRLVDGRGRLVALYEGSLDVDRLLLDLALLDATPETRRRAAAFSEGRWLRAPGPFDGSELAGRFAARGLADAARELERAALRVVEGSPADLRYGFGRRAAAAGRLEEAARHLRAALAEDPTHAGAWLELGKVLHRTGRLPEAVDAYRQSLRAEETDAGHYFLGHALLGLGDLEGTQAQCVKLRTRGSSLAEDLEIAFARARNGR